MEKEKFTLRIEKDKLQEMKIRAIKQDCPLNEFIENAFDIYVGLQYEIYCIKNARNEDVRKEVEKGLIDYLLKIIDVSKYTPLSF